MHSRTKRLGRAKTLAGVVLASAIVFGAASAEAGCQIGKMPERFASHVGQHYTSKAINKMGRQPTAVELYKIVGYALGQELRFLKKGSAAHACWREIDRKHAEQIGKAYGEGGVRQYYAALQGFQDAEMALLTGVPPDSGPPFFLPQPYKTVISLEDLRATPLGKKVSEYNDALRDLQNASKNHQKGTASYNALKAAFDDLKAKRNSEGKPISGLRGKALTFHGAIFVGNRPEAKAIVLEHLINNPDKRFPEYHAYQAPDGTLYVGGRRPPES